MKVAAVISTKGGPGKTTVGANLGAFCADAGLRTLLISPITPDMLTAREFKDLSMELFPEWRSNFDALNEERLCSSRFAPFRCTQRPFVAPDCSRFAFGYRHLFFSECRTALTPYHAPAPETQAVNWQGFPAGFFDQQVLGGEQDEAHNNDGDHVSPHAGTGGSIGQRVAGTGAELPHR